MAQPLPAPLAEHPVECEYLTTPRPLVFPTDATMPESTEHLDQRTALYLVLCRELGAIATIGSDQFVYFDASDPAKSLSPDIFVRRGGPDEHFTSWKTWERGAPEVALEIVSDSDAPLAEWEKKLARYHAVGVLELLRFEAGATPSLRAWDRVEGDLIERRLDGQRARSRVLALDFVVVGDALRLERDGVILLTPDELATAEAERADAAIAVAAEETARADAAVERADAAVERADAALEQAARLRAQLLAAGIEPQGLWVDWQHHPDPRRSLRDASSSVRARSRTS